MCECMSVAGVYPFATSRCSADTQSLWTAPQPQNWSHRMRALARSFWPSSLSPPSCAIRYKSFAWFMSLLDIGLKIYRSDCGTGNGGGDSRWKPCTQLGLTVSWSFLGLGPFSWWNWAVGWHPFSTCRLSSRQTASSTDSRMCVCVLYASVSPAQCRTVWHSPCVCVTELNYRCRELAPRSRLDGILCDFCRKLISLRLTLALS